MWFVLTCDDQFGPPCTFFTKMYIPFFVIKYNKMAVFVTRNFKHHLLTNPWPGVHARGGDHVGTYLMIDRQAR